MAPVYVMASVCDGEYRALPHRCLARFFSGGLLCLSLACSGGAASERPAGMSRPASTPAVSAPPATPTVPTPLAAVRLGLPQGLALPLNLAVERGYFQEEGIELQRVEFASAADAMPPLSTGELDAG